MTDTIVVENINEPGRTSPVNKVVLGGERSTFEGGTPQKEMLVMVQPHLSQNFFPEGAKSS